MNLGNADINSLLKAATAEGASSAVNLNAAAHNNSQAFLIKNTPSESTVLDACCSYGQMGEYLAENKKCVIYGIETDPEKAGCVRTKGIFKDVYNFDFDNPAGASRAEFERFGSVPAFDCILCPDVFEHLKSANEILRLLLSRLKPGGKMLVVIPNVAHLDITINLLCGRFNYGDLGILNRNHLRFFTRKSFIEWLHTHNLTLKEFQIDVEAEETVAYESPATKMLKEEYPALYGRLMGLYENPAHALILQHLFVLTKTVSTDRINLPEKLNLREFKKSLDVLNNSSALPALESLLKEKDAAIKSAETKILEKDMRITCLEEEVVAYRNSLGVRVYESAKSVIKKIFFYKYLLTVKKTVFYLKTYGFKVTMQKAKEKLGIMLTLGSIEQKWIKINEPNATALRLQRETIFPLRPKISIITPVYNTDPKMLEEMLDSVVRQTYAEWELCIADGNSSSAQTREMLEKFSRADGRIKVKYLAENKGIAGNSNEALSMATGEFIALLDHDDMLASFALFEVVAEINRHHDTDLIYSDEDKLSEDGQKRFNLNFKPSWSPDLLRSHNYITHLTVIRKSLIDEIGGFRAGFEGSQDYDLILRAAEKARRIAHIQKILYHWRTHEKSTADNPGAKLAAYEAGRKAVADHIARLGLKGTVENGAFLGAYKVKYEIANPPKISIIMPNKDSVNLLKKCIGSILDKTSYKNYEIIIVENNSKDKEIFRYYEQLTAAHKNVRVAVWDKAFNYSAVNNFGVSRAQSGLILLLNNDMEVINPDWMDRMAEHFCRKEVGAVGAKLYYPDNTIQHAGVIVGLGGVAGHSHKHRSRDSFGYFGRLVLTQNLSAVTAACLMMRKEIFDEIGGFDERYALAFNDVDLCMRIREKGHLIVWTPYAELYHHESVSRGDENTPEKLARFNGEIRIFRKKWMHFIDEGDSYYNPNLTISTEDFTIKI